MTIKDFAAIRDFYLSKYFFNEEFENIIRPLIQSFDSDKGMPLDLENPSDYYASTTATTLIALYHINILPSELISKFHNIIFKLRDYTANQTVKAKLPEDACAWDISESASVWSTVQAVRSLLRTGYKGDKLEEIKDALLWLTDQQRSGGGWGFDIECKSRVYFTALVIHALKMGLSSLNLNQQEINKVNRAINDGVQFVIRTHKIKGNIIYWTIDDDTSLDPDPTTTLYALWVLHEFNDLQYREMIDKGLRFIKNDLIGKEIWEMKEIVTETDTKYSSHKIIVSFTPAFPILLLKLGVSPFDEMCIKSVQWIKVNRTQYGWTVPGYSSSMGLSFASALALWTINEWHRYIIIDFLNNGLKLPATIIRLHKRITTLIILVLVLVVYANINLITTAIFYLFYQIELLAPKISLLSAVLAIIGISVMGVFGYLKSKYFNNRLSRIIRNLIDKAIRLIYAT